MIRNLTLATLTALALGAAPALASTDRQVQLCAAALSEAGVAPAEGFRTKFLKAKGSAVQTITVRLIPISGGEGLTGECKIKAGEVIDAGLKA